LKPQFSIFLITVVFVLVSLSTGALGGSETEYPVLKDSMIVRIGDEPLPILLKSGENCFYKGLVQADKIGECVVSVVEKACLLDGEKESEIVSFSAVIESEVYENKLTKEKVNQIPAGTKIELQ
jgi:hypothetical protein